MRRVGGRPLLDENPHTHIEEIWGENFLRSVTNEEVEFALIFIFLRKVALTQVCVSDCFLHLIICVMIAVVVIYGCFVYGRYHSWMNKELQHIYCSGSIDLHFHWWTCLSVATNRLPMPLTWQKHVFSILFFTFCMFEHIIIIIAIIELTTGATKITPKL